MKEYKRKLPVSTSGTPTKEEVEEAIRKMHKEMLEAEERAKEYELPITGDILNTVIN